MPNMDEVEKAENKTFKEEIARRYLKGEIMESKLAYQTAKGQLIDKLKMEFEIFCKKFLEVEDDL